MNTRELQSCGDFVERSVLDELPQTDSCNVTAARAAAIINSAIPDSDATIHPALGIAERVATEIAKIEAEARDVLGSWGIPTETFRDLELVYSAFNTDRKPRTVARAQVGLVRQRIRNELDGARAPTDFENLELGRSGLRHFRDRMIELRAELCRTYHFAPRISGIAAAAGLTEFVNTAAEDIPSSGILARVRHDRQRILRDFDIHPLSPVEVKRASHLVKIALSVADEMATAEKPLWSTVDEITVSEGTFGGVEVAYNAFSRDSSVEKLAFLLCIVLARFEYAIENDPQNIHNSRLIEIVVTLSKIHACFSMTSTSSLCDPGEADALGSSCAALGNQLVVICRGIASRQAAGAAHSAIVVKNVPVRRAPTCRSTPTARLAVDDVVDIVGRNGTWIQILFTDHRGGTKQRGWTKGRNLKAAALHLDRRPGANYPPQLVTHRHG